MSRGRWRAGIRRRGPRHRAELRSRNRTSRSPPGADGKGSPDATRNCHSTRSCPVMASVTGCSTWRRVFISMNQMRSAAQTLACIGNKFHRARPFVPDRPGGGYGGSADALARCRRPSPGPATPQSLSGSAVGWSSRARKDGPHCREIAKDLHLDMPRPVKILLQENPVVAERRCCLPLGRGEGRAEFAFRRDLAHTLATAAGDSLDQHRPAEGPGFADQTGLLFGRRPGIRAWWALPP